MTESRRYAVLACSECGEHWILDRRDEPVTTTCPRCDRTYLTRLRDPVAAADQFDIAAELRARKLAVRAGESEAFANVDDYGVIEDDLEFDINTSAEQADRAKAALGMFDDAFEAAVQESLDERRDALEDAVND
jgi:hypothetical protein